MDGIGCSREGAALEELAGQFDDLAVDEAVLASDGLAIDEVAVARGGRVLGGASSDRGVGGRSINGSSRSIVILFNLLDVAIGVGLYRSRAGNVVYALGIVAAVSIAVLGETVTGASEMEAADTLDCEIHDDSP